MAGPPAAPVHVTRAVECLPDNITRPDHRARATRLPLPARNPAVPDPGLSILIPTLVRLRINQVLGFLAVGAVLGPFGLGLFAADVLRPSPI
ncbi:hypothetical protein LP420_09345 [Massilia sp. B-10]|nr:hypothetical protein LP420_09345 [Massilia sp. B-10]UUZ55644.1 hypothetical protein LP419_08770 [Massilia sp. H-1]